MPRKDKAAYNAYMREYLTRRYHERRAVVVEMLGGQCVECGSTDDLELDHADATAKSYDLCKILSASPWDKIMFELPKIQLLCAQHHRAKTTQDMAMHRARRAAGEPLRDPDKAQAFPEKRKGGRRKVA